ncbi:hypothetical protein SAMN06273572_102654 [Monaibacterium marinum]|uniref:DUF2946 domain-containing protein n=2 Tax=Pontivivens marinum TaxID=1690039 RepID=A0A2C9CS41_9RHOB|nr:hypothetical protein SAMN06273572_102654 [Monaibacterium marinum]
MVTTRRGDYRNRTMVRLKVSFSKLLVVFALICAMASTGYAHRFISSDLDPALQAYVDAGGSLDSICGDVGGHSGQSFQQCDTCHLVGAALLPIAADEAVSCQGRPAAQLSFTDAQVQRPSYPYQSRKPRGPPLV